MCYQFSEGGFCNSVSLNGGTRGTFRWPETEVNNFTSTSCVFGPPSVMVTRFCASRNNLTEPSIERCRTVITTRYTDIENVRGQIIIPTAAHKQTSKD